MTDEIEIREETKMTEKEVVLLANPMNCNNCKSPLNVSPIFCFQDDDSVKEICGRCDHKLIQNGNVWRQEAYEKYCQSMKYPCANKKTGCDAVLDWNEVLDHELVCNFQTIRCPLAQNLFPVDLCDWEGNVGTLRDHIETNHRDCIKTPPDFDWLEYTVGNHIFFTNVGTSLVTVVIKQEAEKQFSCSVMLTGNDRDSQCFRYQLELWNANKSHSIIFRKSRLEPLGCMMTNLKDPAKLMELDLNTIKKLLSGDTSVIHGCFGIVKKNKKEIMQITGVKEKGGVVAPKNCLPIDENMLQELECPVCNEFMVPPIYICQAGHSICEVCKTKVTTCPNCRSPLSGCRNWTLEKLTRRVHYPCKNREIGCAFVTTSEKVRAHEDVCELTETSCLLRCGHKCLRTGMYNHLLERHARDVVPANGELCREVGDKKEAFLAVYVFGELFRFSIKGSGFNAYKFNMQHAGMADNDPKYRYQLQFYDKSPLGLSLSLSSVCQKLTDIPNKAHATALNVPWDLLKPLLFDSKSLYYKITITKI